MRSTTIASALVLTGLLCGLGHSAGTELSSRPASAPRPAAWTTTTNRSGVLVKGVKARFLPVTEPVAGGEIDWSTLTVYAVGSAKLRGDSSSEFLMAQHGARMVAARNAVLLLQGIRVGPDGRFADVKEGQINVDAVVKDFQEVDSDYHPATRTVTSRLRLPIYGAKGLVRLRGLVTDKDSKLWSRPNGQPLAVSMVFVDARGKSFKPCLMPKVVTASGQSIFTIEERQTVAIVALDPKAPLADGLPGDGRYLLVTASQLTGENQLVVPVEQLRGIAAGDSLSGRIIIITDPAGAPAPPGKGELDRVP